MTRATAAGLAAARLPKSYPSSQAVRRMAAETAPALQEVTVTAQRVAENLQSTPISMTALSGSFIEKFDVQRVTSLETVSPNLIFNSGTGGSSSQVSAFIRGVGQFDFLLTTDPAVGLYVDGVYLARTFGTNLELNDIQRVEVLRGPQGTLFGKNNIGGAINITTLTPTGSGRTDFRASAGNYDSYALDAYTDQRITDDLALGISLMARKSDGWQTRPLGDDGGKEEREGGRATLSWTPTATFSSRLSAEFSAQAQPSSPNVMIAYNPAAATVPFLSLFNAFVKPCCTPPTNIDQSGAEGPLVRDDLHGFATTWINDWKLGGGVDLKSISAYRYSHADFGRDGDNSYVDYNGDVHNEHDTQLSEEVQASGLWQPPEVGGGPLLPAGAHARSDQPRHRRRAVPGPEPVFRSDQPVLSAVPCALRAGLQPRLRQPADHQGLRRLPEPQLPPSTTGCRSRPAVASPTRPRTSRSSSRTTSAPRSSCPSIRSRASWTRAIPRCPPRTARASRTWAVISPAPPRPTSSPRVSA